MKSATIAAALALALFAAGCDSSSGSEENDSPDHIWIRSATPDSALVDGRRTEFTVIIEYQLASCDSGEIDLGFNNWTNANLDALVDSATRFVAKGQGFDTIHVATQVKSWGSTSDFHLAAKLSEHPHTSGWMPLADAQLTLIAKQ